MRYRNTINTLTMKNRFRYILGACDDGGAYDVYDAYGVYDVYGVDDAYVVCDIF